MGPDAEESTIAAILTALKLDAALSLLSQSGHEPLAGEAGSAAWMQGLIDALCELSSRDALTGLANRRHFEMVLAREIDRVARAGEPALLLMLDIDHSNASTTAARCRRPGVEGRVRGLARVRAPNGHRGPHRW
jgi:GAF domain-containing protein